MLKTLLIGTALLVLSARPASAQLLSGGYALVDWNGCCAHGFMVDFAHPLHKMGSTSVSAVGDFGWTRFGELNGDPAETDATYSGGARFGFLNTTAVPVYGQVTFGVLHFHQDASAFNAEFSGNDFVMAFGGGTIIKINKTFGFKPQVDFFVLPPQDTLDADWFFRFTANVVVNLNHK